MPDCVEKAAEKFGVRVELVGCHGQTVQHETRGRRALDRSVRSTWQMGEAAVMAERMRCPVVSDFRPADVAAGGEGAPLVPMLDFCLFRSAKVGRVLLNLGGIANLTAIPAGAGLEDVVAFDTGPGNMVVDHCMATLFGKKYDRGGAVARRGRVLHGVVERVMREGYFAAMPPKSCGREEFGAGFAERLIGMCRDAGGTDADCVATATALTAESVVGAYRGFVVSHFGSAAGSGPESNWAPGDFCGGGWGEEWDADGDAARGVCGDGREGAGDGGAGGPGAGEGGDGVRAAGVADVEWAGGECSSGDGGETEGGAGEGELAGMIEQTVCVREEQATAKEEADSSAALRNDKQKALRNDNNKTNNGKGEMRGFFPFTTFRVRMTIFYGSACVAFVILAAAMGGCHGGAAREAGTVVVVLESSPNNLDPRQGTDAQSERVGGLIFDALVKKDENYNLRPWLAVSWEQPDALTWVFHLRDGVRFQDGRPLEAEDVAWTIESLIEPKLAGLISAKSGAFAAVERAEARDRLTVVVRMKRPDAGLLFNLSDGQFGVVPRGAGS